VEEAKNDTTNDPMASWEAQIINSSVNSNSAGSATVFSRSEKVIETVNSTPANNTQEKTTTLTTQIGTLKINLDAPTESSSAPSATTTSNILGSKSISKKVPPKKLGARKISSVPGDVRIESFESVEKRVNKEVQAQEDFKVASDLQSNKLNYASSRLASVYNESESLYTSKPQNVVPQTQTLTGSNSKYSNNSSQGLYGSRGKSSHDNSSESTSANLDKYKGVKGISSDSYFGIGEDSASELKVKLDKYSSATSISSEMFSNETDEGSDNFLPLKGVTDFFSDIQKRTLG